MPISNFGLDIQAFTPLILGATPVSDLTEQIESYSHTLSADWLYKSASIELNLSLENATEWLIDGIGRHIRVVNPGGIERFVGFVNEIRVTAGNIVYTVGPLTSIANRAYAVYTPLLIVGNYTSEAGNQITTYAEDSVSQQLYGIWEKIIQAGKCLVVPEQDYNEADYARDVYIFTYRYPIRSISAQAGVMGETSSVSLNIVGYQEWLNAWSYQKRTLTASVVAPNVTTATAKIQSVLADDPNGIFSSDYSLMETNPALQPTWDKDFATAKTVIEAAVKVGDGTNRWILQFDGQRRPVFKPVSTDPVYSFSVTDNQQQFFATNGSFPIDPWDVLPGCFYRIVDTPLGLGSGNVYDPNRGFIEELRFTAPYDVNVSGERLNQFETFVNFKGGGGH